MDAPIRFRVFRNLTRRALSIQARVPHPVTGAMTWRTVAYADAIALSDREGVGALFHVCDAGRERVRRTGKKSVHAWVSGCVIAVRGLRFRAAAVSPAIHGVLTAALYRDVPRDDCLAFPVRRAVFYNPHKVEGFTCVETWARIRHAPVVAIYEHGGITACFPAEGGAA